MYIIRGNFFGYFIASSYSSPFVGAPLIVEVPTPSFFTLFVILVCYANFLAYPFWPSDLPLLVVIAFIMQHICRRHMGYPIASILLAMWEAGWFYIPFFRLPAAASSMPWSDAESWWRPTLWCRGRAATLLLSKPFPVFLASSCAVSRFRGTFSVDFRYRTFFVVIGWCIPWRWMLDQLMQPLNPHSHHVGHLVVVFVFRRCVVHPLPNKNSSCRWSTRHHGTDYTCILPWSCAVPSQFGSPWLLCCVVHICRDDEAFHIVMKFYSLCGGLCNGCRQLFEVRRGGLAPVKGHLHDVHHHLPDNVADNRQAPLLTLLMI